MIDEVILGIKYKSCCRPVSVYLHSLKVFQLLWNGTMSLFEKRKTKTRLSRPPTVAPTTTKLSLSGDAGVENAKRGVRSPSLPFLLTMNWPVFVLSSPSISLIRNLEIFESSSSLFFVSLSRLAMLRRELLIIDEEMLIDFPSAACLQNGDVLYDVIRVINDSKTATCKQMNTPMISSV